MRNRTGIQTTPPGPAGSWPPPPPAVYSKDDQDHDHDRDHEDDGKTSLDAYIARLVDAAPALSSQQRDALALLLRRRQR